LLHQLWRIDQDSLYTCAQQPKELQPKPGLILDTALDGDRLTPPIH